ncbi:MAG: phosphoribosyltransferase family protein [Clostridiales bacterium]|nr:phosphoribosyltransferase family protein [Clostridiales bacterium]
MRKFEIFKKKYYCAGCGRVKSDALYIHKGAALCADCAKKVEFTHKRDTFPATKHIDFVVSPMFYTGTARRLLLDLKFHDCRVNSEILNNLAAEFMEDFYIFSGFDFAVPVPLSRERMCERGFNQSEPLAYWLERLTGAKADTELIKRVRSTKRQSRLSGLERINNVKGAFEASDRARGKKIIIADDICTTGSTIEACAEALAAAGAVQIAAFTYAIHKEKERKRYIQLLRVPNPES